MSALFVFEHELNELNEFIRNYDIKSVNQKRNGYCQ